MSASTIYKAKGFLDAATEAEDAARTWLETHGGMASPIGRGGMNALLKFADHCRNRAHGLRLQDDLQKQTEST